MRSSTLLEFFPIVALFSTCTSAATETNTIGNDAMTVSSNGAAVRSLMKNSQRQLEDGNGQVQMEDFLADFSVRLTKCLPNQVLNDVDGTQHTGVVLFRMCPSNSCSDDKGCNSGYADFAVDVGTFVSAYVEDQQDNMNADDQQYPVENYGQCTKYEGNNNYYVGPACTEDGKGIKLAVFDDQYCSTQSGTTFASISNGGTLPYSSGGLTSSSCLSCIDGDGALKGMCMDLYDKSPYRCEREWQFGHYYYDAVTLIYRYGQDVTGCTPIQVMQTPMSSISEAVWEDLILSVLLLLCAAGGFAAYSIWWKERKYQSTISFSFSIVKVVFVSISISLPCEC
jgi:hypothetical protein